MKSAFQNYQLPKPKKNAPPHELAATAERLCQKIGIPFNTAMLRFVKMNRHVAEETAAYCKERGISNINYFTKTFHAKNK